MTETVRRKQRATTRAVLGTMASLVAVVALGSAGAVALFNSTDGSRAGRSVEIVTLPETPNALIAAIDGTGRLASLAVVTQRPDRAGGSVVVLPVDVDVSGDPDAPVSLTERIAEVGLENLQVEAEFTYGLSFDGVAVYDRDGMTEFVTTVAGDAPVPIDVPVEVRDADATVVAPAGPLDGDAAAAAALLTTRPAGTDPATAASLASAVWTAIAASAPDAASAPADPATDVVGLVSDVLGQDASVRTIATAPSESDEPDAAATAQIDRADLALVFGQISPARVSPLNPSYSVRLVVPFSAEQLAEAGVSNRFVARHAIDVFLFSGANVVSVQFTGDGAEPGTNFAVAAAALRDDLGARVATLFADSTTELADTRIVGVDVVVTMGMDFLAWELALTGDSPSPTNVLSIDTVPTETTLAATTNGTSPDD